jgi:hypothetical protein
LRFEEGFYLGSPISVYLYHFFPTLGLLFYTENGGIMFHQKVRKHLPDYAASHPRKQ